MAKSFLIGLEDSAGTERATSLATRLAQAQGAMLVGLAIVDEPDIRAGTAMGIGAASYKHERDEALLEEAHRRAREHERVFLARCAQANVVARAVEVTGRPAETILGEMHHHDLFIFGRDANFRFETEATDTKTWDSVLHRASKPVIVVPPDEVTATGVVVFAYDGSVAATRALRTFAGSGLANDRELHVVTVNASGAVAWELASDAVKALEALGMRAEIHNVVSALPLADALVEATARLGAEMIVMGAFAHSRLRNLFRGYVTHHLVEKTTVPLFLAH